jgi:hypothetical protein
MNKQCSLADMGHKCLKPNRTATSFLKHFEDFSKDIRSGLYSKKLDHFLKKNLQNFTDFLVKKVLLAK